VQGGDPRGDGWGGPGFTIRCENNPAPYQAGVVGMALAGKDTGGSQWFVAVTPQPHLLGTYTAFGRVTSGMDVVRRLAAGDRIVTMEVVD
jgi:cyclophilin family peptidyl-prolyl cis-trans isomerase